MVAPGSNLPDIDSLSIDDRLTLMERLWNSLVADGYTPQFTDEQKAELDRRLAKYANTPDAGISWEDAKRKVREGR